MYTLRYNGRIWKAGTFFDCMAELRRMFPQKATVADAIRAKWAIRGEHL